MKDKKLNVLCITLIFTVAAWLYFFFTPRIPRINSTVHESIGKNLANEIVKSAEPNARIIVFTRAAEPYLVPACQTEFQAFVEALKKAGRKIAWTNSLKLDPLRVASVPLGDFFETLKAARDSDVIVSFLGPPLLTDGQISMLGSKRPQVLAVCAAPRDETELPKLFAQKLLTAAVVPVKLHIGKTAQESFQLIRAAGPSQTSKGDVARE